MKALLRSIGLAFLFHTSAYSAPQVSDERQLLLEVKTRQVELRQAQAAFDRSQRLFDEGLVSSLDVNQTAALLETAQLNYQMAVLALLDLQPKISVVRAIKYQTPDGRGMVKLELRNLTPALDREKIELLGDFSGQVPVPDQVSSQDLRDIFVSIQDTGEQSSGRAGTTIALPYEAHIASIGYGETRTLEFQLLRDVSSVVVLTRHKEQEKRMRLQLEQKQTGNLIAASSTQFSQEGDLGSEVVYDIRLVRTTVEERIFQFQVLNLPASIGRTFLDPETQARLSQMHFPSGVTEKELRLRLHLPKMSGDQVRLDERLDFWAVILNSGQGDLFVEDRVYTDQEVLAQPVGRVRLELIPRGLAKLAMTAASLFSEIQPGGTISEILRVSNTGSRDASSVRFHSEQPFDWQVALDPEELPRVNPGEEIRVLLNIQSPGDVIPGDYEIRIGMESFADNKPVNAEQKIYRVSVRHQGDRWLTAGLLTILVVLATAIVLLGVRLSRR